MAEIIELGWKKSVGCMGVFLFYFRVAFFADWGYKIINPPETVQLYPNNPWA
jgi:hypothetical protein